MRNIFLYVMIFVGFVLLYTKIDGIKSNDPPLYVHIGYAVFMLIYFLDKFSDSIGIGNDGEDCE